MNIYILLFDQFQTLDVFGPVEVLGRINDVKIHYVSFDGGIITSCHQVPIMTKKLPLSLEGKEFTLLIPGGLGTRPLINAHEYINNLKIIAEQSKYCLTVCTGSAVLAKTGLLNQKLATSNKIAWSWVISTNLQVKWQYHARWCQDDKYYTSSGISAGIDMALGFVSDLFGVEYADHIAQRMEYIWNKDKSYDPFAKE